MGETVNPQVYLKKFNNVGAKYRLAHMWKDKAILIVIPEDGKDPYPITVNSDDLEKVRYYR